MLRTNFASVAVAVALTPAALGVLTASPASASSAPGLLGGMDVAGYCAGLGYQGTTSVLPAALLGPINGPNAAYGNWVCVANSGATVLISIGGAAPSFTNLCAVEYPGVGSYAAPDSADDAYSWNCYSLPPASGTGLGAQDRAATGALLQNSNIQAEITQLKTLVAAHKPLQALRELGQFIASQPAQELIGDVLAGYHLPNQQGIVSIGLGVGMLVGAFS